MLLLRPFVTGLVIMSASAEDGVYVRKDGVVIQHDP